MKAWIISNGQIKNYDFYRNRIYEEDYIVCADGGTLHAYRLGITPNVIIGDMDSMDMDCYNEMAQRKVAILKHPVQKDQTDTQLAVEHVIKQGCEEIILIGALGSRFDHSFANISLLKMILDNKRKGMLLDEKNEIYLINKDIKLKGNIGDILSLLPVTPEVTGITTTGLYYGLKDAKMEFGIPYGVSNVFIEKEVSISIREGLLLVIKSFD
ncbi:MAG: thiamine diphosphokinase [Clostridiaceae bacterium]|nr:thiamine diphosphokinase [Clostridiaceae bacterium]